MTKEKWYMTTGRESEEVKRNATKVMFGCAGDIHLNGVRWVWSSEPTRTEQRILDREVNNATIVAYTLGEKV